MWKKSLKHVKNGAPPIRLKIHNNNNSFDWNKLIKQNNKALSSMRQELDVNTLIISYNRIPFFLTNESMAHATYIRGYGTKNMMRTYIGK